MSEPEPRASCQRRAAGLSYTRTCEVCKLGPCQYPDAANRPPSRYPVRSQVHSKHCFQGEYVGTCKFGEDETCPARPLETTGAGQETTQIDAGLLTIPEKKIIDALGVIWNDFVTLPVEHPQDQTEFMQAIHRLQEKVLARPTLRLMHSKSDDPPSH